MSVEYLLGSALEPTRRVLGTRPNMTEILDRVEEDPSQLRELLTSFDGTIEAYNLLQAADLPDELNFLPKIKPVVQKLPTIQEMLEDPTSPVCFTFLRTLHTMRPLMERAEAHQEEPYIAFHVWNDAPQDRKLMGGIFQAYGLTVARLSLKQNPDADELFERRDEILDGLIETMVLNQNPDADNPMLNAVKSAGWLEAQNEDESYLFSEKIRNMANQGVKADSSE